MGVALSPEGRHVFPRMTVFENLMLGAYLRRDDSGINEDLERVFSLFPRLKERERQKGGTMSGGEQQMLAIARAMMLEPKIILLDEPTEGLMPRMVSQIKEIVAVLHREGVAILLVEQNAHAALAIADRAYVLETGRITLSGDSAALRADARVKEAYLGL